MNDELKEKIISKFQEIGVLFDDEHSPEEVAQSAIDVIADYIDLYYDEHDGKHIAKQLRG